MRASARSSFIGVERLPNVSGVLQTVQKCPEIAGSKWGWIAKPP
jgi:hypothetical protein